MKKFNIGDRVIFTQDYEFGTKVKNGDQGTIIYECNFSYYTVGKIYEFKDGRVKIDNGKVIPRNDNDAIKTLDEWNDSSYFLAKFIPLVE